MTPEPRVHDCQVLIIGAGPVGQILALALARAGIRVAAVDGHPTIPPDGHALALHSRLLEILGALGLGSDIQEFAHRITTINVHHENGPLLTHQLGELESPCPEIRDIAQGSLMHLLERAAAGAGTQIWRGWQLRELNHLPDGVEVTLGQGDQERVITCEYLVGADGYRSTVRELIDVGLEAIGPLERVWVGDLDLSTGPSPEAWHIYCHERGGTALYPLGGDHFRAVIQLPEGQEPPASQYQAEMMLAERTHHWIGVRHLHWSRTVEVQPALAEAFQRGRIFLVGDAAHVMPVMGNQGMNLGAQDAYNLAWKLIAVLRRQLPPVLLETYEQERRPVGRRMLGYTAHLGQLAATRGTVKRGLRNWLLPAFGGLHHVRQQLLAELETAPSVPGNDFLHAETRSQRMGFSDGHRFRHGALAGDLVPDAHILEFQRNRHTRLRQWLSPNLWSLVLLTRAQPTPEITSKLHELLRASILPEWMQVALVCGRIIPVELRQLPHPIFSDPREKLHDRLGFPESGLVLIRPDGHIGYRQAPVVLEDWVLYLRRLQRGR